MLSLPLITPRDSHELWFGSPQPYRVSQQHQSPGDTPPHTTPRRNGPNPLGGRASAASLSALLLEERALRARKNNIASFGYSWIKPAGCSKTMLGMKEEEVERAEALAAAAAEMAAAAAAADPALDEFEDQMHDTGMDRDLDDDIPDADADGLVEEGEDGEEEEYMERDLDDDIPEAFSDENEDEDEDEDEGGPEENDDFDNQPDLDDEIPSATEDYEEDMSDIEEEAEEEDIMERDLDDDIPEADGSQHEDEWQHTDTDAEFDDEDDQSFAHDHFAPNLRASTASSHGLPPPPSTQRSRETEAQRLFLQRWSGGGDAFDSSGMVLDEDDLRASLPSQESRRNIFGRIPRRRTGRESLE